MKKPNWNALAALWMVLGALLCSQMGCIPQTGTGLNMTEIRNAAERGDSEAQCQLGIMYAKGEGVLHDDATAYAWLSLASARGEEFAIKNRDIVADKLTPEQRGKAQILANELQANIDEKSPRPSALARTMPSSPQPLPARHATQTEIRAWLQSIKPAAGGN